MVFQRTLHVIPGAEPPKDSVWMAFATSDMEWVDEHFGVASRFAIYRVGVHGNALERVVEFAPSTMDGSEDKLVRRMESLEGCTAIHCLAIGASAARQLIQRRVLPVRLDTPEKVQSLLIQAQQRMTHGLYSPIQPPTTAEDDIHKRFKQVLMEDSWRE
ncbi:MAG: nitrogen fixation protein NifX [Magnetococcales bacterium]|nr:nitrogen fixation protein NifX [Magnetococcales bacterium]